MSNQPTFDDLESVDVTDEVNHDIKLGEAYNELKRNPAFKTLIEEGYLEQKVLASVSLLAVPAIKKQGHRPDVMEDLVAASNLRFWLQMVEDRYRSATAPVLSDEEEEELRREEEAAQNEAIQ